MEFYLVDIKDITSDVPRSQFNSDEIENLAEAIVASSGLIRPVILKQEGMDKYTVVEGHREYYAALRAKEKNPRQAEMVNALVIPAKIEDAVKQQARLFTQDAIGVGGNDRGTSLPASEQNSIEPNRLTNIELRLEQRLNEIQSSLNKKEEQLNARIKEIEARLPKPENPLNLINTLSESELALELQRSRINNAEKIAKNIVAARNKQPQKQFTNYRSVVDSIKGLGDKTLLNIIDAWTVI